METRRRLYGILADEEQLMAVIKEELKREGPSLIKRRGASSRDYPDRYAFDRGYGGGVV